MANEELNIGIVGAGSFAAFAIRAFLMLPGIKVIAVTDINESAARQMAEQYGLNIYHELEQMLASEKIDLVYIATPPFLHYSQSKLALLAGKHVICEKPAALKTVDAKELAGIAQSKQLLYVVNLLQRYNSLYKTVNTIIREKILGHFLHGFFENYASDENLDQTHWFWDESKSGGIFIEHGVHFFDMFNGWLGEGKMVNALQLERPGMERKMIDRVQSTVQYNNGIVNFYHGFDQPAILDRQEMRLQFEYGEITLYGWIPLKMELHGLLQKNQLHTVQDMLGEISIVHHNKPGTQEQKLKGRFSKLVFTDHVTIEYENAESKQSIYQQMLTAMLADQWAWIINREHPRVIDHHNAVESLRIAEQATLAAQNLSS